MPTIDTAELTLEERGMLATGAVTYCQEISKPESYLVSGRYEPSGPSMKEREYYSRGKRHLVQWLDYGDPLPKWFDQVMQGLVDLLTLPSNWDSYGAGPIDLALVRRAFEFVNGFLRHSSPAPSVVPLSSGGLQLEWHRKGIDLEVIFDQGDDPAFYYRTRTGEHSEHSLRDGAGLLGPIISGLE